MLIIASVFIIGFSIVWGEARYIYTTKVNKYKKRNY